MPAPPSTPGHRPAPGLCGPLELIARRQVGRMEQIAGQFLPENLAVLITGRAARLRALLIAHPVASSGLPAWCRAGLARPASGKISLPAGS